jgi:GAF domain-containing protein
MRKIAVLYDAGQAVLSTFDLDEVLQRILAIARDYFHLQNVAILLLDKTRFDWASEKVSPGLPPSRSSLCMHPMCAKIRGTCAPPSQLVQSWPFPSWCATK